MQRQSFSWTWALIALLAGAALTLAFAPYDYTFMVLPALMVFYQVRLIYASKSALFLAYLFGLSYFGLGVWWVYISMHDSGGADSISSAILSLLMAGFWALFPMLSMLLSAKPIRHHSVYFRILAIALIWVLVEYFRGNFLLNGFPWLQIAYTQLQTPLAGLAPLLGVYGISFLVAVSAFSLVECLRGQLPLKICLLVLGVIWGAGGLLKPVQWTHIIGEPLKVSLLQGNISQTQKWRKEEKLNTLRLYRELTEQHWDSRIIIWPETAIPAFLSQVKTNYLEPLAADAHQHQVDLVVSLPSGGEDKQYFNSVLTLGENWALYHKTHLLPFGEYLPLQPLTGWVLGLINIPMGEFTAGADRQTLLQAGGYPFVTTICYEDAFGEQVIRQIADAAFIVNVTNDAWFGDSAEAYQHMQMARMRALETGRYLLRATNTGLTGIVGPDGSLLNQAPLFTTTVLTGSIYPMAGLTPYARYGDLPVLLGIGLLTLLILGINWKKPLIPPISTSIPE